MINVVGAGPAGSYFSYLCKEECRLFEEHKEVGKPVACTGIMTKAIFDLVDVDKDVIVNELSKVRVVGKDNEMVFNLRDKEVVVDRGKFDKFIVEKAVDNGVKTMLNHKFIGCKNDKAVFKSGNFTRKYEYGKLVGADGPNSLVARENGLMMGRKYWVGKQYSVKMRCDSEEFVVFFGEIPDFFGWVVPENDGMARVGVASERFSGRYFDELVKRIDVGKEKFVECQSGLIPMYNGDRACKGDVYLLGDAAGHVKATTGGGLVYGMRGARCLANAINNGGDYEKEWRKEFGRELWFHLQVRRFLNRLNGRDYDEMIELLKKVDLGGYNRDYPFRSLGLLMNPGLMRFGVKHLLVNHRKEFFL